MKIRFTNKNMILLQIIVQLLNYRTKHIFLRMRVRGYDSNHELISLNFGNK